MLVRLVPALLALAVLVGPVPRAVGRTFDEDRGERDLAAAHGLLSRGLDDLAADAYRAFLAAHPAHAEAGTAHYGLAVALDRLGRHDESVAALAPIAERRDFAFRAEVLVLLARDAARRGDWPEAARRADALSTERPDHALAPEAGALRIEADVRLGRVHAAIAAAERFLGRHPDHERAARVSRLLARALLAADRPHDAAVRLVALAASDDAVRTDPTLLHDLALARRAEGDREAALAVLATLRRIDGGWTADARALEAIVLGELGRTDAAVAAIDAFLAAETTDARGPALDRLAADLLGQAGRHAEAAARAERHLRKRPDSPERPFVTLRLGLSLHALGRDAEACAVLEPLLEPAQRDARLAPALLALGDMRLRAGEWAAARDAFDRHLAAAPDDPARHDARLRRGIALLRLGDPQARAALVAVAEAHDAPAAARRDAHRELAAAATDPVVAGRHHAAAAALGDDEAGVLAAWSALAADDLEQAQRLAGAWRRAHPEHPRAVDARAIEAIAAARRQRDESARAAAPDPDAPALDARLRPLLRYELAWLARRADDADAALHAYDALADDPHAGSLALRAAIEAADLELAADRPEAARARLAGADARAPRDADPALRAALLVRLAVAHDRAGAGADVLAATERLLAEQPDAAPADLRLAAGRAALQAGAALRALPHLDAASHAGDAAVARAALLSLGEAHAALGRWAESGAAYARAGALAPDAADRWRTDFGLGRALEAQAQWSEALAAYARVVADHDGETAAQAQHRTGLCLAQLGRLDEAVAAQLRTATLYDAPRWTAAALLEAGRCLEALGRPRDAERRYAELVEAQPDSEAARVARERIDAIVAARRLPGR